MVSHVPIGHPEVAWYPLRGCQNRPISGYAGVSSYSRVVFQMSKMAKLADFHDIWDSMDMSKIAIFRVFGCI